MPDGEERDAESTDLHEMVTHLQRRVDTLEAHDLTARQYRGMVEELLRGIVSVAIGVLADVEQIDDLERVQDMDEAEREHGVDADRSGGDGSGTMG